MDLTERLDEVLATARAHAARVDAEGDFPHEAVAALRDAGLLGLTLPTDVGGLGGGPVELVVALRRVGAECGSTAMVYLMHVAAAMPVAAAPPTGRPELLRELATGTKLATLAFSEPGSRSHFWAPTSQGQTIDGGDTRVKARKSFVTSAGHAPNVVPIWEGIRDYFAGSDAPMDFVLFSNYGRQVEALLAGSIEIAWNTNLAWVRTVLQTDGACQALAMRDTDLDFATVLVTRAGGELRPINYLAGLTALAGRRLALGSRDSAQAAILPVHFLRRAGLGEDDVELIRIDSDLGKHGDTGRSELDAIRAVLDEKADVAAIGVTTWESIGREELMPGALREVWRSPTYCHCNFTALATLPPERTEPWVAHLLAMDWDDPGHRRILELEGLRRWVRPDLAGYASLFEAVREQGIAPRW